MNVYDLCGPDPRPMSCNEVDSLKFLAEKAAGTREPYEKKVFVQIGADIGVSTCAMVGAVPEATIFSVDRGPCEREFENLEKCGLGHNNVIRLLGDSSLIGNRWPRGYFIDFLFIDGDHSEAGVRRDINAWVKHVRSTGIIAFHDYIPEPIPEHILGRVVYAVDDLMSGYKRILLEQRLIAFWNHK